MDKRDARAWLFLSDQLDGKSSLKIARSWRVSVRTVQAESARVRRQLDGCSQNREYVPQPKLVVFFPIEAYTPQSVCRHDTVPINRGSVLCCGVCWRSGMDHHPAMMRDLRTDPKPDRKLPAAAKAARKTRRERRNARREWKAAVAESELRASA